MSDLSKFYFNSYILKVCLKGDTILSLPAMAIDTCMMQGRVVFTIVIIYSVFIMLENLFTNPMHRKKENEKSC